MVFVGEWVVWADGAGSGGEDGGGVGEELSVNRANMES